jgi:hypothetical protein
MYVSLILPTENLQELAGYLASVSPASRGSNAKSDSAPRLGRVHCTPARPDERWIDCGRWRRGHRLAFAGVMTLTQCNAVQWH